MIVAKFSGICPDCRMQIRIGDRLGKHNGRWAHIQCPPRTRPTSRDTRFTDPMARFDAEIQRRENEADQRAFEAKLDREHYENECCHAPATTKPWERATRRCGQSLGPLSPFAPQYHAHQQVRRCPAGHVSFICTNCRRLDFAVVAAPPPEHETIVSDYRCRHCGESVWSDEGLDARLGEIR